MYLCAVAGLIFTLIVSFDSVDVFDCRGVERVMLQFDSLTSRHVQLTVLPNWQLGPIEWPERGAVELSVLLKCVVQVYSNLGPEVCSTASFLFSLVVN